MRDLMCCLLERYGCSIIEATDGARALALMQTARPDLVVLDARLPVLDGVTVLRRIRTCSHVPIIMLGAVADEDMIVQALDLGADDYMAKRNSR